jgi:hypothetical protein
MSHSHADLLPNTGALISLLAIGSGAHALISPRSGLETFGVTPPSDLRSQRLTDNLTRTFAVRKLSLGLLQLAIWWYGRGASLPGERSAWRTALGLCFLSQLGVPILDGWVVKAETGNPAGGLVHWVFAPVSFLLGGGMLGWFDRLV